ncbi:MAG: EamA family transporter [Acidobacteriaceae bacterium]
MSYSRRAPSKLLIVLAFCGVYFCWSATYTVMRIGVEMLPATVFAGVRMLCAGGLMLGFCILLRKRIWFARPVMGRLVLLGVLLLFGGNIGLAWSEEYLPSGLAALIVAVVPLYVAVIELMSLRGDRLRKQGYVGLGLGFCAMIALLWPSLRVGLSGHPMQAVAIAAILAGAFSWAYGSVLSRRMNLAVDPLVAAGWEMSAAGLANVLWATVFWRWPHAVWNWRSVSCIAFMILFGSLLGFTSYIWLISHVPVSKVSTYAYVNPMLAVLLGVVFLGEKLEPTEMVGMVAILASVALVSLSKVRGGVQNQEETVAVESQA